MPSRRIATALLLGLLMTPGLTHAMAAWQHAIVLMERPDLAAALEYLAPRLAAAPGRLELLDAWARVEAQRCPADSLATRLPISDVPAARHFRDGIAHLDGDDHVAACAAFHRAAAAAPDSLAVAVALARAYRSAAFIPDRPSAATVRSRLAVTLAESPPPPRFQAELDMLLAELTYLADDLDGSQALLVELAAVAESQDYGRIAGRVANALGGIAAKRRRLDEADRHYAAAEAVARRIDDHDMLASVLVNQAYQATHRRQFTSARAILDEAENLTSRWGLHRLRGAILSAQGAAAEMSGHRHEAVAWFREAAVLCVTRQDVMSEIGARQRMAYNLGMLGEYHEARAQYGQALQLLDSHDNQFIRNWVVAGLAIIEHKLGHLDRAAELYTEARRLNMAMGDHVSAAWCLQSLGVIQVARGHYRQALLTMHQALKQSELADDPEGMGDAHAAMAEAYLALGDHHRALDHGRRAFALAEQSDSEELLLRALRSMATAHAATAPPTETARLYERAAAIAHRWVHRVGEAHIWHDLAAHHLAHADTAAAVSALQQADVAVPAGAHHQVRARTALLRGRVAGSPDEGVVWADRALAEAEAAGLPGLEWMAHSDLGWYHHLAGRAQVGLEHQRRAIGLVEGLRWRAGADELRRHMLRTANLPYERLVTQLMADPTRASDALAVSEGARAQILAGRLRAAAASTPDTSRTEEDDLTVTLTFLQSRLQEGALEPAARDSLRRRVDAVEREAALVRLRGEDGPATPAAVADTPLTLTPEEHALCYVLGDHTSFLFSVSPDTVRAFTLPPRREVEAKVQRYLDLRAADLPADMLATARAELHRLLLAPALPHVPAGVRLVLVPDGLLHRLPFVYLGDPEPLVARHAVCRAPSLQTLGYLRRAGRLRAASPTSVVAVGCRGGGAGRRHPFDDDTIRELPAAEEEARQIADLYRGSTLLTGDAADETSVRRHLTGARLIHLAAHSDVDQDDVRRTHLVLNRGTGTDDGLLMWPEIVSLPLDADLITLASCRSADGVLARGEGIGGLAQAFLHAGGRCVLGSTIDLPDRDARRLMRRFYRHLGEGLTAAEALRQVQTALLDPEADPRLRAAGEGLVLVGDGAVTLGDLPTRGLVHRAGPGLAAVLGAMVIGCVILIRRRSK